MVKDYYHDSLAKALRGMLDKYRGDADTDAVEDAERALIEAGYSVIDWPELPADYERRVVSAPYVAVEPLRQRQDRANFNDDNFEDRKDLARKAAESLWAVFPWAQAAEGYEFWRSVVARLEQVAETGDHTQ